MRIAVLGCEERGRQYMDSLRRLGQSDLVMYRPEDQTGEPFLSGDGARLCGELDAVWAARPQVALVAMQAKQRAVLAADALARDCHVFVHHPLAASVTEFSGLVEQAESRRRIGMIACDLRFNPGSLKIKRSLESLVIGQVVSARIQAVAPAESIQSNVFDDTSDSVFRTWNTALLHFLEEIDLAVWCFGPGSVVAAVGTQSAGRPALAEIVLRHESGVLSSLQLNFAGDRRGRCCQISGSEGTLYWDYHDGRVRRFGEDGQRDKYRQPEDWQPEDADLEQMRYFLDCVDRGEPTFADLRHAVAALTLVQDASARLAEEQIESDMRHYAA